MTDLLTVPAAQSTPQSGAALTTGDALQVRVTRLGAPEVVVVFHLQAPGWLRDVALRLEELRRFPDGWDGHDARAMTDDAALVMLHILQQVAVPGVSAPDVVLSPEGGLQIEWHQGGWDVEIEARGSGDIEASAKPVDGADGLWSETLIDLSQFVVVLTKFARSQA